MDVRLPDTKEKAMQGWFSKAETALSGNRPADAVACFDMVLREDPFSTRAYCGLSRAYWKQGRTEDALNSLTRALELQPDDRETILQCSKLFIELGKKDYADEILRSYAERNPWDAEVCSTMHLPAMNTTMGENQNGAGAAQIFRNQGIIEFERGKLDRAIYCFEMAIEKDPSLAEAHSDLGVVYQQSGNMGEALEHFYKALDLKPDDPEILSNSARALSQAGEIESAVELFRHYLRRCPEDAAAWGEYEELVRRGATTQWDSNADSPEVAGIYVETATKLMGAGDLPGAAEAVEKALKIKPDAPDAMYVLASLHNRIGQKEEAIGILERALEIEPLRKDCKKLLKSIRNGGSPA